MRIAVIGAGIGGLAATALLIERGHDVSLFDQFEAPRPIGSGLVIQPVGQAVLDRLGAGDAARALGADISRMIGHETRSGRTVLDVRYDRQGGRRFGLAIHRASLFQVLFDAVRTRGCEIVTGTYVKAVPLDGEARWVEAGDGQRSGPFDLIVDASGAGSNLSPLTARPLPYGAIWGTVPWPTDTTLPPNRLTQRYERAARMAGVLPLGRMPGAQTPLAAIFWSLPVTQMDTWKKRSFAGWKSEAETFWPEFGTFLKEIRSQDDMTTARYSHGTMSRPYAPHMVFIGDAAHRASPQLGQGANMALLDALALAEALRTGGTGDPLAAYAAMRRWHVRIYQGMSWAFTPQYQSDSQLLPWLRDRVMMPVSRIPPVPRILTRLVGGDLIPPLAGVRFP